jgi:hypothetical protein
VSDTPEPLSDTASDVSDSPAPALSIVGQTVGQTVGRSSREVLQLIYSALDSIADLDPELTRFIDSTSIHPGRGVVGTLVVAFADGETWYVEVERERA